MIAWLSSSDSTATAIVGLALIAALFFIVGFGGWLIWLRGPKHDPYALPFGDVSSHQGRGE